MNNVSKLKPVYIWFRSAPPATPANPPIKPMSNASVKNIRCICPLDNPLVDSNPISRRLRLKETSDTVEPMYHATMKTGIETTMKDSKRLGKVYWKVCTAKSKLLWT